ncbi:hypothetical protein OQH60_05705 [Campylobacter sp. MIT 21-1685]|uniref:hypothetical protein n=1 Tax=unclassified Campylobacter TaxID=2593542 RepID=UPI00224AA83D|nr:MULTISPECIES: hypothetical protein [unclassified Campylobacter]MCX2683303.1 hypothetical protein [Campylobacter sp. MIT 21-1684]MCX2807841.1 hypothetical protein [Campylobacter sp. MIT 21-1685]
MSLYTQMRRIYRLIRDRHEYFALRQFSKIAPIGHYESPYPSEIELVQKYEQFSLKKELYAIDLNEQAQLNLYENFKNYVDDCPMADKEKNQKYRFYDFDDNVWFGRDDARHLYAHLMYFRPKNVIEIGSGFSTALMLDTNEILNHQMNLLCIEPRAQRLKALLKSSDNLKLIEEDMQDIDREVFSNLGGGGYAFY